MQTLLNYLFGLMFLVFSGDAYSSDAINQYLSQAQDVLAFQGEVVAGESGWLDQAELRYSASNQDEYGLAFRFRPKNSAQRSAEEQIYTLLNQQYSIALGEQLNDELNRRYQQLIDLIESASELQTLENKTALSFELLGFKRNQVATENFRIADLQSAQLEYQRNQQQIKVLNQRLQNHLQSVEGISLQQLEDFLLIWSQQVSQWENFLLAAGELLILADNYQLQPSSDRADYQLAQQNLKLVRGESRGWLKYVELKWVDRPSGDQETSLGLSIPLNRDELRVSQRVAELNRASMSLQAGRVKLSRSVSAYAADLEWQQDQARLMQSGLRRLEQQSVKLSNASQPEALIGLQAEIIDYRSQLQRIQIRGLRNYIDLLHAVGYLAKKPLVNWLLRERPRL